MVLRHLVPLLRYPADCRTVFVVALYFGWMWALWSLEDVLRFPPTRWVLWAGAYWLSLTGAIVTHNLAHVPVFRSAALNQAFQVAVTLVYGHPVSSFVPGHNLSHHRHTQTRRDAMRTTRVDYRWNALNLLLFMPTVAPRVMANDLRYLWRKCGAGAGAGAEALHQQPASRFRFLRAPSAGIASGSPALTPYALRFFSELAALLAVSAWLFSLDARKAVLCWLLPHLWAQYAIVTINFLQHDGCGEGPWRGARNFTGRLLNALLFNNGFHTLHHMRPTLHWSELPAEHKRSVAPRLDPRLVEPSLPRYLFRTFVYPGRRVDYTGQPHRGEGGAA